jgi:hypothetical protein
MVDASEDGAPAAGIVGIRAGSTHPAIPLPKDAHGYPEAVGTKPRRRSGTAASTAPMSWR